MKSKSLYIPSQVLVLLAFVFWSFYVYQYHRWGGRNVLSSDQLDLMKGRELVKSEWDYFWWAISMNRTRTWTVDDLYLFRPAMLGYLAAVDIFFRDNLYVYGGLSIALNGIAAFGSYLLLSRYFSHWLAFLLSLISATRWTGSPMVTNRHVSPYILSIFFFSLSLLFLGHLKLSNRRSVLLGAGTLFFSSILFHEHLAWTLILFGGFLLFWHRSHFQVTDAKKPILGGKELALLFLSGPVGYFLWNVVDFIYRGTPALLAGRDNPVSYLIPFKFVYWLCYMAGQFSAAFLIPQVQSFVHDVKSVIFLSFGTLVTIGVGYVVYRSVKKSSQGLTLRELVLSLWAAYGIGFWVLFTIGRRVLRGEGYFADHSHYIANFALMLPFAVYSTKLFSSRRSRWKTWGIALWTLLVANQLCFGFLRLKNPRFNHAMLTETRAQAVKAVSKGLGDLNCFAGHTDARFEKYIPSILLYRKSCQVRSGFPVFFQVVNENQFFLTSLDQYPQIRIPISIPMLEQPGLEF